MTALSVVAACVMSASSSYGLPPAIIWSLLSVEGGQVGTVSRNSNGTQDLGPMQINTIHLKEIARRSDASVARVRNGLVKDPCYNIAIGAWHLSSKISEVDGDFWGGVGRYHSKTPRVQKTYMDRLLGRIEKLYGISNFTGSPLPLIPSRLDLLPVISADDLPENDPMRLPPHSLTFGGMTSIEVASAFEKSPDDADGAPVDVADHSEAAHEANEEGDAISADAPSVGGMVFVPIAEFKITTNKKAASAKNSEPESK